MSNSSSSNNPFAVTLCYYYQYRRAKLTANDLVKIANKYQRAPAKLLPDLQAKYGFPMPDSVHLSTIRRILGTHDIPQKYCSLIDFAVDDVLDTVVGGRSSSYSAVAAIEAAADRASTTIIRKYNDKLDVYSINFDASFALEKREIIVDCSAAPVYDNMIKVSVLFPNDSSKPPVGGSISSASSFQQSRFSGINNKPEDSVSLLVRDNVRSEKESGVSIEVTPSLIPALPLHTDDNSYGNLQFNKSAVHLIAELSVPNYSYADDDGTESSTNSPLLLLFQFMSQKIRVRVTIRRRCG